MLYMSEFTIYQKGKKLSYFRMFQHGYSYPRIHGELSGLWFLVSFNWKLSPKANVEFKLTHLIGFRDLTDLVVSMLYTVVLLMYNFLDFLSLCICVQILCFFYEPKEVDISIYIIFFSWSFYWLTELQFGPGFQFWGPLLWVLPQDLLMPRLGIPRLLFQCEYMILLYEWLLDQNPPADFCF